MLTRDQVTEQIREWMERVQAANAQLILLGDMTGDLNYDAPFPAAVEALISGYTAALSQIIGDEGEWLEYFRFNCAFGDRHMVVFPGGEGSGIKITGPEAIAQAICWDREHGEAAR